MSLKFFTALVVATIVYTITVLYGIISGFPLRRILINGLSVLIFSGAFSWFIIHFIQVYSESSENESEESTENESEESTSSELKRGDMSRERSGNGSEIQKEDGKKNKKVEGNEAEEFIRKVKTDTASREESAADFAPLDPPVLEVTEQNQGADSK